MADVDHKNVRMGRVLKMLEDKHMTLFGVPPQLPTQLHPNDVKDPSTLREVYWARAAYGGELLDRLEAVVSSLLEQL